MSSRFSTAQSTAAVQRWGLPAILTLAPMAALMALTADAVARQARPAPPTEATAPRDAGEPIMAIVSIKSQQVTLYDADGWILRAPVSSGTKGRETPSGVFSVVQKDKDHHSNLYDDAWMPNMLRITWSGIALHGGPLPGYPASHGCVRLPKAFAEKLYDVTQSGTPVIIADAASQPSSVYDPGLLLGAEAKDELGKASKKKKKPTFSKSDAVTSILVSSADKSIYVIQNGDIVAEGKAEIADPGKKLGSNVFILEKGDEDGFTWQATGYSSGKTAAKPSALVVERVKPPADVQTAIDERMKPGMVFITTDQPATPETRSGKDFTVMDSEGK